MASLYGAMGDKQRMISAYIELIETNDAYLQTVQNALNRSIDFSTDNEDVELLRVELLRKIQKYPQSVVYSEMLTWLFLQQRDFNSAFIQLKAIDKRLNEDGYRVLNLAGLAINNAAFNVASKCYRYVAEKGPKNPYYGYARAGELRADFEAMRNVYPPDSAALNTLADRYEATIKELGKSNETMAMIRQKALLESAYLNDLTRANVTLNDALDVPGVSPEVRAEIKLDLAEILIARDYIWDASILSSQVDKDFKFDVIGYKAKLLNARISYYTGDFEWAQAQLDVLKGSTSKLISNDAMRLSLLITDNLNLDTILDPMLKFAQADLMVLQRRFDEASSLLDSINTLYPGHALSDEILLKRAEISESKGQLDDAIAYYQEVLANHYFDIHADDALFKMAEIYENKIGDQEKAQELYKQLILDFPGSLFVVEARKRFRALRGDEPNAAPREIFKDGMP
jgi:tetratricopeptide (TPR) repeat protein